MTTGKQLIYKNDARRAVLKANPSLAYCINNLRVVDAVEVVRCKDCKYYDYSDGCYGNCELDGNGRIMWNVNDFCSYGERKNNGV